MTTIPASEIKRRGMRAVDHDLQHGPVHVIKNDRPTYVILSVTQFRELVEAQEEATIARVKAALEDVRAGRVHRSTADEIIDQFGLDG